jgi:hypothetical protein
MLHSPVPFDLLAHHVTEKAFGFSPKISTTVENAVEKPGVMGSSAAGTAVLLVFL